MTKRIKKRIKKVFLLEYYQPIFNLLHKALHEMDYRIETPHPLRESFWSIVPPGEYEPIKAREIVNQFQKRIEDELYKLLSKHSIAYWLHSYRRLSPEPAGINKCEATVFLVRRTLEAAIQKYAKTEMCDGISKSDDVPEESIFDGMLMAPEFKRIREYLKQKPQLVLTKFGPEELKELYDIEKLAYEMWRSMATLRILGKGASLTVSREACVQKGSSKIQIPFYYDNRSEELDKLITVYDRRQSVFNNSATATVFDTSERLGNILLPQYNVQRLPFSEFKELLKCLKVDVQFFNDMPPNFVWSIFNLKQYLEAHELFSVEFENKHSVSLKEVLAIIGALYLDVILSWRNHGHCDLVRYWQKAYVGPWLKPNILKLIRTSLEHVPDMLNIDVDVSSINIGAAFEFLELNETKRDTIDIGLGGPLSIFLPCSKDRYFIDYAWGAEFLYNLFFGISPSDQNFKGDKLEELVRRGSSFLPVGSCKALDNESRQIDAAFALENILIIVECRATGRSFGMERGDPASIAYRNKIITAALKDIDEKGTWLAVRPVGRNYDISRFMIILPIVVTPFVEYIPSVDPYYWLSDSLPRVLTPDELKTTLENGNIIEAAKHTQNIISVRN